MPASFKGNETLAEIEASPVWKDPAHEWIVQNKVLRLSRQLSCGVHMHTLPLAPWHVRQNISKHADRMGSTHLCGRGTTCPEVSGCHPARYFATDSLYSGFKLHTFGFKLHLSWCSSCSQATFLLADEDRSGGLGEREHFAFSHPEDSSNAVLHAHLRRQDVIDRDRNHDGRWGCPIRSLSPARGCCLSRRGLVHMQRQTAALLKTAGGSCGHSALIGREAAGGGTASDLRTYNSVLGPNNGLPR